MSAVGREPVVVAVVAAAAEQMVAVAKVAKVGTSGPQKCKSCQNRESTPAEEELSRAAPRLESGRVASTRMVSRIGRYRLRVSSRMVSPGSSSRTCTNLQESRDTRGPTRRRSW